MIVILKMNPAADSGKLQGFHTAPRCAICRSEVVCLLTGINYAVRPPKSHDCYLYIGHCSRERTSADVCLK
jgi:hypothetical protein